jgi:hypothetical protein
VGAQCAEGVQEAEVKIKYKRVDPPDYNPETQWNIYTSCEKWSGLMMWDVKTCMDVLNDQINSQKNPPWKPND